MYEVMSTMRRLAAIPVLGVALTLVAFGVVRGASSTGPAHGVRLIVAIEPPVDDAARTMAAHVAGERLAEKGLPVRVVPSGDQLVAEIGTDDPEFVRSFRELLERTATLELHAVDAASPWLARVVAFAATDPQAPDAGVRVDAGILTADERLDHLAPAEADAIGCTGLAEDGKRRCMRRGDQLLAHYVSGLAARDPSLAPPSDRVIAYGPLDGGRSWRAYVLQREVLLDGHAIRHAEVFGGGVAVEVNEAPQLAHITPGVIVAFVLDGKVRMLGAPDRVVGRELHVPTIGSTEDAAIASALDLVAVIQAGAMRPLHVRSQEPFSRATGFLPRAWPFFAIGAVFSLAALVLLRRR